MKLNLINNVIQKLIGILESVGSYINSLPTEKEKARFNKKKLNENKKWLIDEEIKRPIIKASKKASPKHKGKRDTSTQVFNHPRKDYHA